MWDNADGSGSCRALPGLDVAAFDEVAAKKVGELLRSSGTSDLVDAHVALLVPPGGHVLHQ